MPIRVVGPPADPPFLRGFSPSALFTPIGARSSICSTVAPQVFSAAVWPPTTLAEPGRTATVVTPALRASAKPWSAGSTPSQDRSRAPRGSPFSLTSAPCQPSPSAWTPRWVCGVDEAGQHEPAGRVDHLDVGGDGHVGPDGDDPAVADEDRARVRARPCQSGVSRRACHRRRRRLGRPVHGAVRASGHSRSRQDGRELLVSETSTAAAGAPSRRRAWWAVMKRRSTRRWNP